MEGHLGAFLTGGSRLNVAFLANDANVARQKNVSSESRQNLGADYPFLAYCNVQASKELPFGASLGFPGLRLFIE